MQQLEQYQELLAPIHQFLQCPTPTQWVDEARKPENLKTVLIDHLLCELKAGQSAMYLIRKYAVDKSSAHSLLDWFKPYEDFAYRGKGSLETLKGKSNISKAIMAKSDSLYSQDLIDKMVLLIKEELHHFYQVLEIMDERGIDYEPIPASRYAKGMLSHMATYEPQTLIDKLIIGAISKRDRVNVSPNWHLIWTRVSLSFMSLYCAQKHATIKITWYWQQRLPVKIFLSVWRCLVA
ncbi:tRNA-(ms[2]io[6]A)-hydroxylase [Vibrio ponticus]|nr:tRNA-(ms[2]io[6]A)-hydroxylase [Vibrio ponticus]